MISDSYSSFYPNGGFGFHINDTLEEMVMMYSPIASTTASQAVEGSGKQSGLLLYNMSVLRDKVEELGSIVGVVMSTDQNLRGYSSSFVATLAIAGTLLEDVIVASSSLMFAFQQLGSPGVGRLPQLPGDCGGGLIVTTNHGKDEEVTAQFHHNSGPSTVPIESTAIVADVIELDAADLLAKYTHYCQICGKGFKRDANLRMHMRAHGDEYKTKEALRLINKVPEQQHSGLKYSCPQEGCRWNKNHPKFQPLKSIVCVKNHYRRSHCQKTYVCNRCHRKQFSVLSDLRTHEKHCGHLRWQCSCGTSFSRKDKLMGHVALFIGHAPVVVSVPVKKKESSIVK